MQQFAKITQVAHVVPEKIVTNKDLSTILETSDEWITTRTGIKERRIATKENTSDLALKVGKALLEKAGISPDALDFIIVATMTPDFATPSVASLVQGELGAKNALAFDVSAACSGFIYALSAGEKFIRTGSNKGLVIGAEVLSKIIDWEDRTTAVLFGDGAGGVLLEASETEHFFASKLQSDGARGKSLTASEFQPNSPFSKKKENVSCLKMNGRDIFDFAVRDVPQNILATLEQAEKTVDEVDYFLLHQANIRIIDKMARKLKTDRQKFLTNMDRYGNTSAASVPILLSEAVKNGIIEIGQNQTLMITGFGGGLTWGSILLSI